MITAQLGFVTGMANLAGHIFGAIANYFIYLGLGSFWIVCAVRDFDWYFDSKAGKFFVDKLGRGSARVLIGLVGVLIIFFAAIAYIRGEF